MGIVCFEFITLEDAFDVEDKNDVDALRKKIKSLNESLPTLSENHVLKPFLDK